jgi:hypothetical protein
MLQLLYYLTHLIQPFSVVICFVCAWALVIIVSWGLWAAARDSVSAAKKMHQIPCTGCQFFTNDYHLKCTVRPYIANTEEAINCQDYQPHSHSVLY